MDDEVNRHTPRQLGADQLDMFDVVYMRGERLDATERLIRRVLATDKPRPFRILDVGGGNGAFADYLLDLDPGIEVTVLDTSVELLNKNRRVPRKRIVFGDATALSSVFDDSEFDLVCFNWVLHHLVVGDYESTRRIVARTLSAARSILAAGGLVSVFENCFDGYLSNDDLPGRTILLVSGLRGNESIVRLLRRLGVNTAGVGVAFRSTNAWLELFHEAELGLVETTTCDTLRYPKVVRLALLSRPIIVRQFTLEAA